MLVLKIHSGSLAGQKFSLNDGTHTIGRSADVDITLPSSQVSKKHALIQVQGTSVYIKDLNSRNGTFINGLQIREEEVNPNDKITIHDIVITIREDFSKSNTKQEFKTPDPISTVGNLAIDQNSYQEPAQIQDSSAETENKIEENLSLNKKIDNYIEAVMLPGVYKLTELFEFKWVLGVLLGVLILFVTILSAIPSMHMLKSSVEKESQRRALTITKNMANNNKSALAKGMFSNIDLSTATNEPGVLNAIIIDNNGAIIAPSNQAGKHPDITFLHSARLENKISVLQINSNEIGAIVPIKFYNSKTGNQSTSAFAFVRYDMGSIAIDNNQTLSLYVQILVLSLVFGGILFYFIFKLFEYPFKKINSQLDEELKNPSGNINLIFRLSIVQKLISNINSSLVKSDQSQDNFTADFDRTSEINNIVQLVGFPAMAITNSTQTIASFNQAAELNLGFNNELIGQGCEAIPDQALKLNIIDLMNQCSANPSQLINNQLDIGGTQYDLMGQAIYGKESIEYFVISFVAMEGE